MTYTYTDINGKENEYDDIFIIKDILKKPYEYWLGGGGDSAIHVNSEERLIFFKTVEGVFVMQHPDYLAPVINNESSDFIEHYVGGQKMEIPTLCICNEEVAFEIIEHYVLEGKLHPDYSWVDIYELEEQE